MALPATLLRVLRPGIQVPLANAVACGGLAALVMHVGRTAQLRQGAFSVGLVAASLGSLVAMSIVFRWTKDPDRARAQAFLWPPLVGALVGATADLCLHVGRSPVSLSIAGFGLGGGADETVMVAFLSSFVGLLGTALLWPQIQVLARARDATTERDARVAALAEWLALSVWGVALGVALLANGLATVREHGATWPLVLVGTLGLLGQCLRAAGIRGAVARGAPAPYR